VARNAYALSGDTAKARTAYQEWTVRFGRGRVYSSTFGHVWKGDVQPPSLRCAGEQTLILRTLQWLARRQVTVAIPGDFPTEAATSIGPEIQIPASAQ
jgi:type 1 glutamine amidotransferase